MCQRSDAHLGCRPFRPRGNAAFGGPVAQTHRGRRCVPPADRQQRRNRPHHAGRAAGLIASRAHFRNQPYSSKVFVMPPTQVAASDYSACRPDLHPGRCPVCRLLCRPDRPEPAAGRALRAHLSVPVLIPIQPRRLISGILVASLKERLGGRYPPWKGSASAMHEALLFARAGKTSSRLREVRGGSSDPVRRGVPVIHRPRPPYQSCFQSKVIDQMKRQQTSFSVEIKKSRTPSVSSFRHGPCSRLCLLRLRLPRSSRTKLCQTPPNRPRRRASCRALSSRCGVDRKPLSPPAARARQWRPGARR